MDTLRQISDGSLNDVKFPKSSVDLKLKEELIEELKEEIMGELKDELISNDDHLKSDVDNDDVKEVFNDNLEIENDSSEFEEEENKENVVIKGKSVTKTIKCAQKFMRSRNCFIINILL